MTVTDFATVSTGQVSNGYTPGLNHPPPQNMTSSSGGGAAFTYESAVDPTGAPPTQGDITQSISVLDISVANAGRIYTWSGTLQKWL